LLPLSSSGHYPASWRWWVSNPRPNYFR